MTYKLRQVRLRWRFRRVKLKTRELTV